MEWDEPETTAKSQTAVRIVDLRNAIYAELETLRQQSRIIEDEQQNLRRDNHAMPGQFRGGYLLRALLRVGGDELQNVRRRYLNADEQLQQLVKDIDKHNADIDNLSFLRGLVRRRAMKEKARELARQREQAVKEHGEARQAVESLVRRLSRPESMQEAVSLAEELQVRYRETDNTRRYLKIRQRLLQDDIELYEETDQLLALLDDQLEIDVSDGELSRLLRDGGFKSRLRHLVG